MRKHTKTRIKKLSGKTEKSSLAGKQDDQTPFQLFFSFYTAPPP
jgi:hypothetical protein